MKNPLSNKIADHALSGEESYKLAQYEGWPQFMIDEKESDAKSVNKTLLDIKDRLDRMLAALQARGIS